VAINSLAHRDLRVKILPTQSHHPSRVVPSPAKAEIVNLTDAAREHPQREGR